MARSPLTWRSVAAPDTSNAVNAVGRSAAMISAGLASAGEIGADINKQRTEIGSRNALANMARYSDSADWAAAQKDGSMLAGVDARYVDQASLGRIDQKGTSLLGNDATRQQMELALRADARADRALDLQAQSLALRAAGGGGRGGSGGGTSEPTPIYDEHGNVIGHTGGGGSGGSRSSSGSKSSKSSAEDGLATDALIMGRATQGQVDAQFNPVSGVSDLDAANKMAIYNGRAKSQEASGEALVAGVGAGIAYEQAELANQQAENEARVRMGLAPTPVAEELSPYATETARAMGRYVEPEALPSAMDIPSSFPSRPLLSSEVAIPTPEQISDRAGNYSALNFGSEVGGPAGGSVMAPTGGARDSARFLSVGGGNASPSGSGQPALSFGSDVPSMGSLNFGGRTDLGYDPRTGMTPQEIEAYNYQAQSDALNRQTAWNQFGQGPMQVPAGMLEGVDQTSPEYRDWLSGGDTRQDIINYNQNQINQEKYQLDLAREEQDKKSFQDQTLYDFESGPVTQDMVSNLGNYFADGNVVLDRVAAANPDIMLGNRLNELDKVWSSGSTEAEKIHNLATNEAEFLVGAGADPELLKDVTAYTDRYIKDLAREHKISPVEAAAAIKEARTNKWMLPTRETLMHLVGTNQFINDNDVSTYIANNGQGQAWKEAREVSRQFDKISEKHRQKASQYSAYVNGNEAAGLVGVNASGGLLNQRGESVVGLKNLAIESLRGPSIEDQLREGMAGNDAVMSALPPKVDTAPASRVDRPVAAPLSFTQFMAGDAEYQQYGDGTSYSSIADIERLKGMMRAEAAPNSNSVGRIIRENASDILSMNNTRELNEIGDFIKNSPESKEVLFDAYKQEQARGNTSAKLPSGMEKEYRKWREENPDDVTTGWVNRFGNNLSAKQREKAMSDLAVQDAALAYNQSGWGTGISADEMEARLRKAISDAVGGNTD